MKKLMLLAMFFAVMFMIVSSVSAVIEVTSVGGTIFTGMSTGVAGADVKVVCYNSLDGNKYSIRTTSGVNGAYNVVFRSENPCPLGSIVKVIAQNDVSIAKNFGVVGITRNLGSYVINSGIVNVKLQ